MTWFARCNPLTHAANSEWEYAKTSSRISCRDFWFASCVYIQIYTWISTRVLHTNWLPHTITASSTSSSARDSFQIAVALFGGSPWYGLAPPIGGGAARGRGRGAGAGRRARAGSGF